MVTVVIGLDDEDIRHDGVDCVRFLCGSSDGGGIITAGGGSLPGQ